MSSGRVRLIFLVLFVVNCILWSQSRYGKLPQKQVVGSRGGIAKRILFELEHSHAAFDFDGAEKHCRPLAFPIDSQCTHVQKSCPAPDTFLSINYLRSYFCETPTLRPLVFVGLLTWLVFLFSTLGISAADFFTPNLATIAFLLGLDENVAGVTFLAFGNGSPDVFSTFSAMRANSGSLAIGELLGAASFIVSCVVGSMCIIKPFRVDRNPFLRDVGFFTVAVSLLLVTLWDSRIVAWEAGILIGLYVFYVMVVVVGSWWERRREKKKRIEALIRAEYDQDTTHAMYDEPYRDDPSSSSQTPSLTIPSPTRARAISTPNPPRLSLHTHLPPRCQSRTPSTDNIPSRLSQLPSFSLVGALEFRHVVASLQNRAAGSSLNMFDTPTTPYAGGHYHAHSKSRPRTPHTLSRELDPWENAVAVPLNERSPQQVLITPLSDEQEAASGELDEGTTIPSVAHTLSSPTVSDGDTDSQQFSPFTLRQRIFYSLGRICHILVPSLHHFKSATLLGKTAAIFAAPAVTALTLTLPVVVTPYESSRAAEEKSIPEGGEARLIDFEEEGVERALVAEDELQRDMHDMRFNKWLMAVQCVFGPLFCIGVLFNGTQHFKWFLIATAIAGLTVGILVATFSDDGDHPTARAVRCSMGFLVAIVWIMAIADEVVNVLQTFGFIFGLSDAIIGLTIFAIGNSLADFVANMAVAVFAPIMGFSACFGGPMLNILLGVGISGTYIMSQTQQPYLLPFSTTLVVSTVGLLTLLLATLIYVPWNGFFLTRKWGVFLIISYTIIMFTNVVVELSN